MRSQRKSNDNFEESLLKLVRTLPTVLKYLPSEKAQARPTRSSPPPLPCIPERTLFRPGGSRRHLRLAHWRPCFVRGPAMRARRHALSLTAHRWAAQDARAFVQSLQYWLGGNSANLEGLLLNTAQRYVPALKGVDFAVAEPQLFPDVGIWHPLAPSAAQAAALFDCLSCQRAAGPGLAAQHAKQTCWGLWAGAVPCPHVCSRCCRAEVCAAPGRAAMYDDVKEYLNWYDTRADLRLPADAPIVGLVLQRSHLVTGDEGHYSGVVSEMEARGAKARPTPRCMSAVCNCACAWLCADAHVNHTCCCHAAFQDKIVTAAKP